MGLLCAALHGHTEGGYVLLVLGRRRRRRRRPLSKVKISQPLLQVRGENLYTPTA